jgi:hypothetical protein
MLFINICYIYLYCYCINMIRRNWKFYDWIDNPRKKGYSIIVSYFDDGSFDDYEAEVEHWKELEYIYSL